MFDEMNANAFSNAIHAVVAALDEAGVDVLLIGGFAVNHYGYTRATLDVDFLLAAEDVDNVKDALLAAGFTYFSLHETVAFFQRPNSPVRVDFVKTNRETLAAMLKRARQVAVHGTGMHVPLLTDLLAMKLFAVAHGTPDRREKDMQDIVHLCAVNDQDMEKDLHPLCRTYATEALYEDLCRRIKNLKSP